MFCVALWVLFRWLSELRWERFCQWNPRLHPSRVITVSLSYGFLPAVSHLYTCIYHRDLVFSFFGLWNPFSFFTSNFFHSLHYGHYKAVVYPGPPQRFITMRGKIWKMKRDGLLLMERGNNDFCCNGMWPFMETFAFSGRRESFGCLNGNVSLVLQTPVLFSSFIWEIPFEVLTF